MPDNKQFVGGQDRARVAAGQDYEVRDFAEKHGLSMDQARALIRQHGNNRKELDRAAQALRKH